MRSTLRSLGRAPGFAAFALLAIALGIAACTLLGSFAHALLTRDLPIPALERTAYVIALREGFDPFGTSFYDYELYRREARTVESTGVSQVTTLNIGGAASPQRVVAGQVAHYFETLQLRPALGRLFAPEELVAGGPPAVLLGHDLWQRRFGGADDVLGRTLEVNGTPHVIVGVMPRGLDLPQSVELWTPLPVPTDAAALGSRSNGLVLRLKPGITLAQLRSELTALNATLQQSEPSVYRDWEITAVPLRDQLFGDIQGRVRRTLRALAWGVGLLVVLASANVASLLLARNISREREIAVRQSLGATRWAVARPLLLESLLLALGGGALGVVLAAWLAPLAGRLSPVQANAFAAHFGEVHVSPVLAAAAVGFALLLGALFGLLPALRASRCIDLAERLRAGGRTGTASPAALRALRVLVSGEIALASLLLVGAGLLARSFQKLQQLELGWDPVNRVQVEIALPAERYPAVEHRAAFADTLLARARALPGIKSAAITTNLPLALSGWDALYEIEGRPADGAAPLITSHRIVTPGFKETLGLELAAGRFIEPSDTATTRPVVVVSAEFARVSWPGQDPLGQRVRRVSRPGQPPQPWLEVVGVVRDTKEDRANYRVDRPVWYLAYHQFANPLPLGLVLHVDGPQLGLGAALRAAVQAIDPAQPVSDVAPLARNLEGLVVTERFAALLMGSLSVVGLVLAAVGLFGVISYSVRQRLHDFGVRLALGASRADVLRLVLGQGLLTATLGLGAGLVGGWATSHLLAGLLHETDALDPWAYVATAAALLAITLAASVAPALRALHADPTTVLRTE